MNSRSERIQKKKRLNGRILQSPLRVFPGFQELGKQVFTDGAISRKHKELMALAVAISQNCFDCIEHRVEEVLDLGGSDAELAEAMDVGLLMGGTQAVKSVRHAFEMLAEIREAKTRQA